MIYFEFSSRNDAIFPGNLKIFFFQTSRDILSKILTDILPKEKLKLLKKSLYIIRKKIAT